MESLAGFQRSNRDSCAPFPNPSENVHVDPIHFASIERFIVVLYDRTSPLISVNDVREELFCKKNRSIDRLPPTQDALLQHVR